MTQLRDHTFLGTTQSLCPECLALVPAKIIAKGERVYFRKRCPSTACARTSSAPTSRWYDRMEFSLPGKVPAASSASSPTRAAPTTAACAPSTSSTPASAWSRSRRRCNLHCPMCYAASGPGGKHLSLRRVPGGRSTAWSRSKAGPRCCSSPAASRRSIREFLRDPRLRLRAADRHRDDQHQRHPLRPRSGAGRARWPSISDRLEVYLQFDGFDDACLSRAARRVAASRRSWRRSRRSARRGVRVDAGRDAAAGRERATRSARSSSSALERPWITGISFQPATYSGRHVLPEDLERRITFPDVIKGRRRADRRPVPRGRLPAAALRTSRTATA